MLADTAASVLVALAVIVAETGGFTWQWGRTRVGVHDWVRLAAAAAIVFGVGGVASRRRARSADEGPAWERRLAGVVLGAFALASIGYWVSYLSTVSGGADSYGYVSASELLRQGRLVVEQPLAAWLPVSDPLGVTTQLAYVPAPDGSGSVPGYPLGFPALVALATAVAGAVGAYVVPPLCGVVCLLLAWRLGTRWYGALGGWLALALVAWEPLVVTYAKQPMSDIPATMWVLLAVWWLEPDRPRPLLAGFATGAAFVTRPGGLGAIAVLVGYAAWSPERRWSRVAAFAAGAVPFAILQAWLQQTLYGSVGATGYGSVAALYAGQSLAANLAIYAEGLWRPRSVVWFAGLIAAAATTSRRPLVLGLVMLVVSATPYLLYFEFDHWETLRFVLPSIVLCTIATGGGLALAVGRMTPRAADLAAIAAAAVVLVSSTRFLRAETVPAQPEADRRYTLTAARLSRETPPDAVVLAMQHSGSIRHYARRTTLRFDVIQPHEIEAVVAAIEARGLTVYVALEGIEQRQFEERFSDALTRLRRLPLGQERNVHVWQLASPRGPA